MAKLSPVFNSQVVDENGAPAVGWQIETHAAGSSTPQATYTSIAGDVPQANPIILNALGLPDDQICLTEGLSYKLTLKDENGVVKAVFDDVTGVGDSSITVDQWKESGVTPTYVSATSFTVPGDQTSAFHPKRRFKATTGGGSVFGAFDTSSYDGSSLTTVTTVNDSGSLDSGLSAISLGVVTATNTSLPKIPDFTGSSQIASDAVTSRHLADSALGFALTNGVLTASVALNALTIAIKTKAGTDPSATDPVLVTFRNAAAATGDYEVLSLTAATSFVISSGSTLGTTSATLARLWIVGFNDGGTFRLGAINLGTTTTEIGDDVISSSTAEGGAGAADSASVFYTGTAVSSKPMRVLGYTESTQATAGTWATAPSKVQMVQSVVSASTKQATINASAVTPTTSGTSKDITGIPSWATRVTLTISGVSTNGTSQIVARLGTASGFDVTGYESVAATASGTQATATSGVLLAQTTAAANTHSTAMVFHHAGDNTWITSGVTNVGPGNAQDYVSSKTLPGVLTQIRLTTIGGADTFDAGSIRVFWE